MPYPIPSQAVVRAVFKSKLFGQTVLFGMTYKYAGPDLDDGAATLGLLNAALQAGGALADKYMLCVPDAMTDNVLKLQWTNPNRWVAREFVITGAGPSGGGTSLTNVTAGITFSGNFAARHGRGTKHIVVPTEVTDFGAISNIHKLKLQALADAIRTSYAIGGGNFEPGVYGVPTPAAPFTFIPTTTTAVPVTVRTQRRRTVGLGE